MVEEEKSEDREKTDQEQHKLVKFGKRTILKGRLLRDLEEEGMSHQYGEGGALVSFYDKELGEILGVPAEGYNDYKKLKWPNLENFPTSLAITKKFVDNKLELEAKDVYKKSGAKDAEVERLKKRLAEVETDRDALRAELAKDKEKNKGILHDTLKLLQAKNQELGPSQP
ncbi:uncharacterized protein [Nicotiana sylvestris]|uniref:uncharacterized protein n=1 Tax=Nicotiana sylvestris TaxID=4096 RepID=UPI00388C49E2